ncbi:hypothetical protein EYF80_047514 [Liparis tanakae]|uniref:Uncharacterized protein n=1 Tax=Liparis tanakae TaxID=230148 RepID=A0A4Z2FPR9_9TELE|nr:hypothetical protein EYF80_047514 [Liparis tanakae]
MDSFHSWTNTQRRRDRWWTNPAQQGAPLSQRGATGKRRVRRWLSVAESDEQETAEGTTSNSLCDT